MAVWNLYRKQNSDGSTKDWAVTTNSDCSISTRWGKTATHLPSISTRNGIRQFDIEKQKQDKGYVFLAEVEINDDDGKVTFSKSGQQQAPELTLVTQPEVPISIGALYWHIDCQGEHAVCLELGVSVRRLIGDIQAVQNKQANPVRDAYQDWEGWQQLVDLTLNAEQFTQSGQIKHSNGVMPFLFLLALKHKGFAGIEIDIATESSREVSTELKAEQDVLEFFGTDLESIRESVEALGLLKPKLNLASAMSDTDDRWF